MVELDEIRPEMAQVFSISYEFGRFRTDEMAGSGRNLGGRSPWHRRRPWQPRLRCSPGSRRRPWVRRTPWHCRIPWGRRSPCSPSSPEPMETPQPMASQQPVESPQSMRSPQLVRVARLAPSASDGRRVCASAGFSCRVINRHSDCPLPRLRRPSPLEGPHQSWPPGRTQPRESMARGF